MTRSRNGVAPPASGLGDPSFPLLHIRPPAGWLNDPNGLSHVDGTYHVFFQYNPASTRHEHIGWGHYTSPDLIGWHEQPQALAPRPGQLDSFGCWTGVVTIDGVPTAVYSGAVGDGGDSSVLLATSDRSMREWRPEKHAAATTPPGIRAMRDPFLLDLDGHRWAVQCAVLDSGSCSVAVHSCEDLRSWTYRGQLFTADGLALAQRIAPAAIWECPQLCRVDGTWVLILSPLVGVLGEPLDLGQVAWLTGDLRPEADGLRFEPHAGGRFDTGPAFYAPQVLVAPDRVLAWGWVTEHGRTQEDLDAAGWAGVVSFPRELHVRDGVLVSEPAAELTALRRHVLHDGPAPAAAVPVGERCFELEIERSPDERPSELCLELRGPDGTRRAEIRIPAAPTASLRAFVDGSVIEVFVDGQPTRTYRAYPSQGDQWWVRGDRSRVLRVWRLGLAAREVDTPDSRDGS